MVEEKMSKKGSKSSVKVDVHPDLKDKFDQICRSLGMTRVATLEGFIRVMDELGANQRGVMVDRNEPTQEILDGLCDQLRARKSVKSVGRRGDGSQSKLR